MSSTSASIVGILAVGQYDSFDTEIDLRPLPIDTDDRSRVTIRGGLLEISCLVIACVKRSLTVTHPTLKSYVTVFADATHAQAVISKC